MEDLKNILKELKELNKDIGASGDMVLDCATRIFISNNIQNEKYNNHKLEKPLTINDEPTLASEKQKSLLNKLKIPFDDNITKKEAYILIKEKKG